MKRILIAEDDPVMSKLIEFNLKREGFDVTVCRDGPAVLRAARENCPDLALLDLNLPGMTGLQLSLAFEEDDLLKKVPRMVVTAQGKDAVFDDLYAAGVKKVFTKPFSPSALAEAIRAELEQD